MSPENWRCFDEITKYNSMSNNFYTLVITDCVGDRAIAPHEANLFDMEQKYADLVSSAEIIDILESRAAL